MANAIFQADISLSFDGEAIPRERIQYVLVDYRFDNVNIVPILYVSLKIPLDLHDQIISNYQSSKFYVNIVRRDVGIGSSMACGHISGAFSYVCSNKEQNTSKRLNMDGTDGRAYISTTIGLVSSEMMDNLRSSFNDMYLEEEVENLVLNVALGDMGGMVVHSPIKYSDVIDQFLVPPTSSRFKFLETLFERYPFFDTYFNFFMDFGNVTYLLDKTGEPVESDGNPDTIYFDIVEKDDAAAIFPGNAYVNGAARIHVNAAQTSMNVNESVGQIANTVSAFDYDTGVQELTVAESFSGVKNKTMYLKSDNAAVYKNEIVNNTEVLELYKQAIDSSIITPNRLYIVTQTGNYADYNGRYTLAYKQEVFAPNGSGAFNSTTTVGLKRINAIEVAAAREDTAMAVRRTRYGKAANKKSSNDRVASMGSKSVTVADRTVSSTTKKK